MSCSFFNYDNDKVELTKSYLRNVWLLIENKRFLNTTLENERHKEEIKIAKEVKNNLLEKEISIDKNIDINLYSSNFIGIGGDFYDCVQLSDNRYLIGIGDVSGHGTSAAFNMSQLNGIFKTVTRYCEDPKKIPSKINRILESCLEAKSFVSFSFFFIDTSTKTVNHARCGHTPAYLKRDQDVTCISPKGIGLGIVGEKKFNELTEFIEFKYNSGDFLILYTDGFTETKNHLNELYGEVRLQQTIKQFHSGLNAKNCNDLVVQSVQHFANNKAWSDDMTSIIIKF